jgi:hypothetical protein
MIIKQSLIEAVAAEVNRNFDLDVEFRNTVFIVFADSSKGINEFEARLVAAVALEDGLEDVAEESLPVYLNLYVDIVDTRSEFRAVNTHLGTWEAIYGITPGDETNLYSHTRLPGE